MSERSVSRALLKIGALTTAVALAFGAATTGASAQDEPETPSSTNVEQTQTPAPTSEQSTPPSTTDSVPPSSSESVPPSTTESQPATETATPPVSTSQTATPPPASEQPKSTGDQKAALADLKATVVLDKAEYQSHEPVRLTLTVTNQSAVTAEGVRANVSGVQVDDPEWGEFSWRTGGGRLAAGETRVLQVAGAISRVEPDGRVMVSGNISATNGDANQSDNSFIVHAKVTQTFGSAHGHAYGDNGNGTPDAGEDFAGVTVSIYGGSPAAEHRTTTDQNGRFSFKDIPAGKYSAYFELPGGWVVHSPLGGEYFTVEPGGTAVVDGRAERPYSEVLTAFGMLDAETYAYPGQVKISLTLRNTGSKPLVGIKAGCGRSGDAGQLGGGAGWGDLHPDGKGVTLAAGETRSFEIIEALTSHSRNLGSVRLFCDFAPNPSWNADGPTVSDSATVTGGLGRYTVQVAHDKNGDQGVQPGEELSGLKVVLKDQRTGATTAERTTGADGRATFTDLPVGTYWAVVDGPWKLTDGLGARFLEIVEADLHGALLVQPGTADVAVIGTVRFEKSLYESHETVRFWMSVTNVGGTTAERVRLSWAISAVELPQNVWGDFSAGAAGIRLAVGETRTFEASGRIQSLYGGRLGIWGSIDHAGQRNPRSGYSGWVDVVQTKGDVTGVVYTDKNRNGQQDAGEAAAGAEVKANGGVPYEYYKTTTDAEGRYSFKGLPSGDYYVGFALADGWVVHHDEKHAQVRVQPGAPVDLTARAERPYHESLAAKMELDKDVYRVGEEARVTITLTNSSDRAITGITAACNFAGDSNQLGGRPGHDRPTGWGDLLRPAGGVTVGPGETRTFVAVEAVPDEALGFGKVVVGCVFSPGAGWNTDGAEAFDSARVPGGFGAMTGYLIYDRNGNRALDPGEAIGNTRIVLHDRELGVDVAEAMSDDRGNVRFDRVPAGDYWARVDGPWKFQGEYDNHVQVFAGSERSTDFWVVPDVAPGQGAGSTEPPAPAATAGGSGDALAKTGASVLGLGLLGALLVAFGFGASVIGRRRQAA